MNKGLHKLKEAVVCGIVVQLVAVAVFAAPAKTETAQAKSAVAPATKSETAVPKESITVFEAKPKEKGLRFLAIGRPSAIKINGEGQGPKGELSLSNDGLSGALEVDMTVIKTGIDLRDEHMHGKYLQTKEFPKATLKFDKQILSTEVKEAVQAKTAGSEIKGQKFSGLLNLHGQDQKVEGAYDLQRKSDNQIQVTAKFTVSLSQFKIEIPSYLGIKVAENVDIDLDVPMEIKHDGASKAK